jgi:hypothetical protein
VCVVWLLFNSVGKEVIEWLYIDPILTQGAWSMLVYSKSIVARLKTVSYIQSIFADITLTQGDAYADPLNATYDPPSDLAAQINDVTSPTYLDPNLPNVLLNLNSSRPGMERWATTVGLRPQDLFGICLSMFLIIAAAIVVLSLLLFCIDKVTDVVSIGPSSSLKRKPEKSSLDTTASESEIYERGDDVFSPSSPLPDDVGESHRVINRWWHNEGLHQTISNMNRGSHLRLLQGNLTRLFLVFHFPIVTFCVFQFAITDTASIASIALAGVGFAVFGIIIPAIMMWRVYSTSSEDLQSNVSTLLALGPLYDTFGNRSHRFMAFRLAGNVIWGVVIGGGQRSGTAQAIIILVFEIIDLIITVSVLELRIGDFC